MTTSEREICEMALVGLQKQLNSVNQQIATVKARLGKKPELLPNLDDPVFGGRTARSKHQHHQHYRLSPEGRANIIQATKRRWARWHRERLAILRRV